MLYLKSNLKFFYLTVFIILFLTTIPSISNAQDSKFSVGAALDYGIVIHGTFQEANAFYPFEFTAVGRYRVNRFLAARADFGFQYTADYDSLFVDMAALKLVVSVGGEVHVMKQSSLVDPYLFIDTGYPRPIAGGFGIAINPMPRWAIVIEAMVGQQSWIKLTNASQASSERGFQASGSVGALFRF
jgi:hypothetical protein